MVPDIFCLSWGYTMKGKNLWYGVLGILPAYGAYNSSQLYGDLWNGLIAGLILAAILYAGGEAVLFVARKLRRGH